jgi:protein TonB
MQAWRQRTGAQIAQMARRLAEAGLRGRTVVCMAVGRNGRVVEASTLRSSGSPELDGAALAIVRKAAPFAPLPSIYPKPVLLVRVPIAFSGRRSLSPGSIAARFHGM